MHVVHASAGSPLVPAIEGSVYCFSEGLVFVSKATKWVGPVQLGGTLALCAGGKGVRIALYS